MQVGGRQVVHTASLILPENEDAWIEFVVQAWKVRLQIVFENTPSTPAPNEPRGKSEPGLRVEARADHGRLVFHNWTHSLPIVTTSPVQVGTTSAGSKLVLMAWHTLTGPVHRVDLQFYEEAAS